jgi:hypothetical protein
VRLLIAVALTTALVLGVQRWQDTRQYAEARSRAPVRAFKATHVCPSTGKMDADAPCPRYVVDNRWPLCAGGPDTPENMQFQEYQESLVKDRLERAVCRLMAQLDACRRGTP